MSLELSRDELIPLIVFLTVLLGLVAIAVVDEDEGRYKGSSVDADCAWWGELRLSAHSRLVLPPDAFIRKPPVGSKFSAKSLTNKGRIIYTKARRMLYKSKDACDEGFNDEVDTEKIPAELIPLLCFVNTKSGGKYGTFAMKELKSLLNPVQVIDLQKSDPMCALTAFSKLPSFRVLVCGGDGTVRWIFNCIEQLPHELRPPVAILPLGTGNDLARCLGWGAGIGFGSDSIPAILQQVQRASVAMLDRWKISFKDTYSNKEIKKNDVIFNNYFGIGVDAQIVLNFHTMREQSPERFFSRLVNQLWYGIVGWNEIWTPHCTNLKQYVKLIGDGKVVDLPEDTEGLIFSNIPSYGGGMKLWDDRNSNNGRHGSLASLLTGPTLPAVGRDTLVSNDTAYTRENPVGTSLRHRKVKSSPNFLDMSAFESDQEILRKDPSREEWTFPSIQDKKIEVVAVTGSLQLAQLKLGLTSCTKIAQCQHLEIEILKQLPLQVDGEPWVQKKCTLDISPSDKGQVTVLKKQSDHYEADHDISDVLNWADREGVITYAQKNAILREFSRRREIIGDRSTS